MCFAASGTQRGRPRGPRHPPPSPRPARSPTPRLPRPRRLRLWAAAAAAAARRRRRRRRKVRRAGPQLPVLEPSPPADTQPSAHRCLDSAVADATAEAEAGAARSRRRRHSPPPGTRPPRTPGNSERTTPPRTGGGEEADPQSGRRDSPSLPPSPHNSSSRLIADCKPRLLPPRPPTHAPPP